MKWILKAVVQKVISWMPNSQKVNYWFQKNVTKGVALSDQYFSDKLMHAKDHLTFYKKHVNQTDFTALELGSGWYPVVPLSLFLAGAKRIISIDISPLMNAQGIKETAQKFVEWEAEGKLDNLDKHLQPAKMEVLKDIATSSYSKEELLTKLNLTLQIKDARNTGFTAKSFDLICSNNTYEHVYPDVLKDIVLEFERLLKPGGINSHFIDMSDHFAHLDTSITIYNFLRYSERQWQRMDNSVQPQNRWRKKDYLNLYQSHSVNLIESVDRPGDVSDLEQTNIQDHYFTSYSKAELAISHTHLVSS